MHVRRFSVTVFIRGWDSVIFISEKGNIVRNVENAGLEYCLYMNTISQHMTYDIMIQMMSVVVRRMTHRLDKAYVEIYLEVIKFSQNRRLDVSQNRG